MRNQQSSHLYLSLVMVGVLTTLAVTSWVNVDALVIPKLILVFSCSLFFLPLLILNSRSIYTHWRLRVLAILSFCFLIQLILVIITSPAPIEQEIFGKTGRGLGFLFEISILIMTLVAALVVEIRHIRLLILGLIISVSISSIYSIFQKFGYDIFDWYTRTNGVIGTLGNPNFQSALAALALVPSAIYFGEKKMKFRLLSISLCLVFIYTIYICQSTQGYLIACISIITYSLLFLWYKKKFYFVGLFLMTLLGILISILGMLNIGPLSEILYKLSVRSRGEFFRTALRTANENPIFGVGLDSFGDYSQFYKSSTDFAGVNEFTDNAHNYLLQYAATGGYPLAIIYFCILILTLLSFIKLYRKIEKFDAKISAIFSVWMGFLAQALVSPGSIPIILWGALISGSIIGLATLDFEEKNLLNLNSVVLFKPIGYFLFFFGLVFTYPYFNSDRLQLKSLNTQDAILAIESAKSYPESVLRYSRIGVKLLESGLPEQALEVGRAAVKFNPNAISAWALILANSSAPIDERIIAQKQILRLDPHNSEIRKIEFQPKK